MKISKVLLAVSVISVILSANVRANETVTCKALSNDGATYTGETVAVTVDNIEPFRDLAMRSAMEKCVNDQKKKGNSPCTTSARNCDK